MAVDPYFLDAGDLTDSDEKAIEQLARVHEDLMQGHPVVQPRGRPARAATYRIFKWDGELGDEAGRFVGPLSVHPELPGSATYAVNAQIVGFHVTEKDWSNDDSKGALTIEFRAHLLDEPLTWLYARQFDNIGSGATTLGNEFVSERHGKTTPIVTDQPTVEIRIQLMRQAQDQAGLLSKMLRICSAALGGGALATGVEAAANAALPSLRIPGLPPEGVAFSQGILGGTAKDSPVWRSGFIPYGIAEGGSRLSLTPGLWVVIDEDRWPSLKDVRLEDSGGQANLLLEGEPLDANYLVLNIQITECQLPRWAYAAAATSHDIEAGSMPGRPSAAEPPKGGVEEDLPTEFVPKGIRSPGE